MATVRIYKVAELLGTTSQEVAALLKRDHGIEVKSASSTIEEVVARQFVERLARQRNIALPSGDWFAEAPAVKAKKGGAPARKPAEAPKPAAPALPPPRLVKTVKAAPVVEAPVAEEAPPPVAESRRPSRSRLPPPPRQRFLVRAGRGGRPGKDSRAPGARRGAAGRRATGAPLHPTLRQNRPPGPLRWVESCRQRIVCVSRSSARYRPVCRRSRHRPAWCIRFRAWTSRGRPRPFRHARHSPVQPPRARLPRPARCPVRQARPVRPTLAQCRGRHRAARVRCPHSRYARSPARPRGPVCRRARVGPPDRRSQRDSPGDLRGRDASTRPVRPPRPRPPRRPRSPAPSRSPKA